VFAAIKKIATLNAGKNLRIWPGIATKAKGRAIERDPVLLREWRFPLYAQ
jgi:hypothetical protein